MNQSSQDNYQEAADDSIFFQELKLTGIQKNKRIGAGSQQSRRSQYALEDSFQTQELSRNYNTRSNSFIDRVNQISQRSKFQERSHSNQQSWRYARQDPNASRERERSREYSLSSQPYQHQRQQDLSFEHIDEIQQLIQELDQQDSQFSQQLVQNDIDQESKPEALLEDEIKYLNQYLSSIDVDNNEKEIEKLLLEYPYVCRECPKPFTDLLKFREHMTEKHFALALRLGIAKYLCKICNLKAFQQKRYYLSHLINCYCSKHKIELTPQQIQKIKIADQLLNSHKYDLQNNIKRLNVQ